MIAGFEIFLCSLIRGCMETVCVVSCGSCKEQMVLQCVPCRHCCAQMLFPLGRRCYNSVTDKLMPALRMGGGYLHASGHKVGRICVCAYEHSDTDQGVGCCSNHLKN